MVRTGILIACVLAIASSMPGGARAQDVCKADALGAEQVKAIVDAERAVRSDLPKAFERYRWTVSRQGCYYVYIEFGLPETPGVSLMFRINQFGAVVDVVKGR